MQKHFLSIMSLVLVPIICSGAAVRAQSGRTGAPLAAPVATHHATYAVTQSTSIETIVALVRLNPSELGLRRSLALALIRKGLTVKAADQMRGVIAVAGPNAADLILLGDASRYSGDLQGAIKSYRGALSLNPMSSKARSGLSLAYAASGDLRTAYDICQNGLAQLVDAGDRTEINNTLIALHDLSSTSDTTRVVNNAY